MMLTKIKLNSDLSKFIEDTCCENGICVTFEDKIDRQSYLIIKVDKFYNSWNIDKRPPSIDCLIIRECENEGFGLTLVEMKSISNSSGFNLENMKSKFTNTLNHFIKVQFKNLIDLDYKEIKLIFVTKQELYKRDLGLKMEVLINTKFKFNNRNLMITPRMPNPTIKKCY